MQIKNITIKNYRGIKSLEKLEFSLLNAIVGKNDAGKSAILHAINSFFMTQNLMHKINITEPMGNLRL